MIPLPEKENILSVMPEKSYDILSRPVDVARGGGCFKWTALTILGIILLMTVGGIIALFFAQNIVKKLMVSPVKINTAQIISRFEVTTHVEGKKELVLAEREISGSVSDWLQRDMELLTYRIRSTSIQEVFYRATCYYSLKTDRAAWSFHRIGNVLYVSVPSLYPLKPAIDTASIRVHAETGWLVKHDESAKTALLRDLSSQAMRMAWEPEAIDAVRETARRSLSELIYAWIPHDANILAVQIKFADEHEFPIPQPKHLF